MSVTALARRRLEGTYTVDEWGHDPDLVAAVAPFFRLAWPTVVEGAESVPPDGPAVIVTNRRFGLVEPIALALALRRATGRDVRFLGVPDLAPVGPALHRLGGAGSRSGDLAGLLRAGQAVVVPLARSLRSRRTAGTAPARLLAPGLQHGVPVVPAAVVPRRGRPGLAAWRVTVGEPLVVALGDDADDLAEAARAEVQALLDQRGRSARSSTTSLVGTR